MADRRGSQPLAPLTNPPPQTGEGTGSRADLSTVLALTCAGLEAAPSRHRLRRHHHRRGHHQRHLGRPRPLRLARGPDATLARRRHHAARAHQQRLSRGAPPARGSARRGAAHARLRPGFEALLAEAASRGWPLHVVSHGLGFYLRAILPAGVAFTAFEGVFDGDRWRVICRRASCCRRARTSRSRSWKTCARATPGTT